MSKKLFFLIATFFVGTVAYSQTSDQDFHYRRSSLFTILMESNDFPMKDTVLRCYADYPFPDKYNQHLVSIPSFNPDKYALTPEERDAAGFTKSAKVGSMMKGIGISSLSNVTGGMVKIDTLESEMPYRIEKYINDSHLASKLVNKWFHGESGSHDMSLVQERGYYNATELEASVASNQISGMSALGDAGEELINNTFVTFTQMDFVLNEPIARTVYETAILASKGNPIAEKAALAAYNSTKDGYTICSKTWLYKLTWNDSIASIFYSDYWGKPKEVEESNLFSMEYVGYQKNSSIVLFSLNKSPEQIIKKALGRNMDNVYAKLQKEYDVFKPKFPVLTIDPITAEIGMKEGLEGGEKFDVYEMVINPETQRTSYEKVSSVTADKKHIWDNRYNAGEEPENVQTDKKGNPITVTTFKGGSKKIQPGMILKQVK